MNWQAIYKSNKDFKKFLECTAELQKVGMKEPLLISAGSTD